MLLPAVVGVVIGALVRGRRTALTYAIAVALVVGTLAVFEVFLPLSPVCYGPNPDVIGIPMYRYTAVYFATVKLGTLPVPFEYYVPVISAVFFGIGLCSVVVGMVVGRMSARKRGMTVLAVWWARPHRVGLWDCWRTILCRDRCQSSWVGATPKE